VDRRGIYFADIGRGVLRPPTGGQWQVVVPVADREEIYGPHLLPDGDTLIFTLGSRGMPTWDERRSWPNRSLPAPGTR